MANSNVFQCPNCGSPLDSAIQPGQTEVKCPYCGTMVIIPPELRVASNPSAASTFIPNYQSLSQNYNQTPPVGVGERNSIQRLLLFYPAHNFAGWIFRGWFYISLLSAAFWLWIAFTADTTATVSSTSDLIVGSLCFVVPSLLLAILFHWLAIRSDLKAEQAKGS